MRRFAGLSVALVLGVSAWLAPAVLRPAAAIADDPGLLDQLTATVSTTLPAGAGSPPDASTEAQLAAPVAPGPSTEAAPLETVVTEVAAPLSNLVVGAVAEGVTPALEPTTAGPPAMVPAVIEAAGPLLEPAGGALPPVLEVAEPLLDPVLQTVAPLLDPLQPVLGPAVDPLPGFAPGSTDGGGTPTFPPDMPAPAGTTDLETTTEPPTLPSTPAGANPAAKHTESNGDPGIAFVIPLPAIPIGTPDVARAAGPGTAANSSHEPTGGEPPPAGAAAPIGPGRAAGRAPEAASEVAPREHSQLASTASIEASSAPPVAAVPAPGGSVISFTPSATAVAMLAAALAAGLALMGTRRMSLEWLVPPSRAIAPEVPPA